MDPQATCGRIVHYHMGGGQKRAAIVNADTPADGTACLTVMLDTGPSVAFAVPYSEEPVSGSWSWMPYQHQKAKTERGNESESAEDVPFPRLGSPSDAETGDGPPDASADVPVGEADPLGGPTAGVEEAGAAEGATQEAAVVDGAAVDAAAADAPPDQGEPLEPEKAKKSKKK